MHRIRISNPLERNFISVFFRHLVGPLRELATGPFEAMVAVPEFPRIEILKQHVIFGVGRRHQNCPWTGMIENHPLKCLNSIRFQMLDDLDKTCHVKALHAPVTVGEPS